MEAIGSIRPEPRLHEHDHSITSMLKCRDVVTDIDVERAGELGLHLEQHPVRIRDDDARMRWYWCDDEGRVIEGETVGYPDPSVALADLSRCLKVCNIR